MKKFLVSLFSAIMLVCFGTALAACGKIAGKIDAPTETIEAELGSYAIPIYDVIDEDGMVLAGYTVTAKSITAPDGSEVPQAYNSIMVETPGIYTFVYTTGTKDIKDATVKVDFGDRTAPTIKIDEEDIPAFFMTGNTYKIPAYTINGGPDSSKCWTKVYTTDENEVIKDEVSVNQGNFVATERTGKYLIWIHVEDAAGNFNDYKYYRTVDGPKAIEEDVIMYFDDEFGERQVSPHEELYGGEYVAKDTPGAFVRDGDDGAFKVSLNNVETINNEVYFNIDNPAITDVSDYDYLSMWIYNDNDFDVQAGFRWWNDTLVPAHQWTRVVWSVKDWGNNRDENEKAVPNTNIIGTQIRLMGFPNNESGKPYPRGTFYFSTMKGGYGSSDSIAELDYERGASRVQVYEPSAYTGGYSAEKAYGDASGAYKITMTKKPEKNGEIYLRLTAPLLKDVRAYDYLSLYIYNANAYEASAATIWAEDQKLSPGVWNRVKFPVSLFGSITDIDNDKPGQQLQATDITGFTLRICGFGEQTEGVYYLSSIVGEHALQKNDTVISFNSEADEDNMKVCLPYEYTGEYSTEQHYGDEAGSFKVTVDFKDDVTALRDNHIYLAIAKPQILDIRAYNYLSVWIYNSNSFDAMAGILWGADTLLKAGEWTELRILNPDHHLAESWVPTDNPKEFQASKRTYFADITNLIIRIFNAGTENKLAEGSTFYISGIKAVANDKSSVTKLYAFDGKAPESGSQGYLSVREGVTDVTVSTDTEKVYNGETASTKLTYNRESSDIYEAVYFGKPLRDACFDYMEFAVYNDTGRDIKIGFEWGGDTLCKNGEWTVVKWKLSGGCIVYENNGTKYMPLENLSFRMFSEDGNNFVKGASIYLSAVYGYNVAG